MNTVTRIAVSSHAKTATLAFALLALGVLACPASFAGTPNPPAQVTENGTVSLAGIDVLTPQGVRAARWRIHQMALRLCMRLGNLVDQEACVDESVADAERKLSVVIEARLAERQAQSVAAVSRH